MELPRESIHPNIWKAYDEFRSSTWSQTNGTPTDRAITARYEKFWFKNNWFGMLSGGIFGVAAMTLAIRLKPLLGKPWTALFLLGGLAIGVLIMFRGAWTKRKSMVKEELEMLIESRYLTAIQKAYAEALVAIIELNLPADTQTDLVNQLNDLLEEEARLLAVRERGSGLATPTSVVEERDSLRKRLSATEDPISREALSRSLEICEGRLAAVTDIPRVVERVDAQLELIAQSIRGMRDTLHRLQTAPGTRLPELNLDSLRETVSHTQVHGKALEAAVDEVHQLTARG